MVNALEEFKVSVYGDKYDGESEVAQHERGSEPKKRKATAGHVVECASYDWGDLADNGKVKLKVYLLSYFNSIGVY